MILWHVCSYNLQGMYHRPTGCDGCAIYYAFSICKGDSNNFEHKNPPHQYWEGKRVILYKIYYYTLSQHFWGGFLGSKLLLSPWQILNTFIYNTPSTPRYMPCKFQ